LLKIIGVLALLFLTASAVAQDQPRQLTFVPASGHAGRVVIVLSGHDGMANYNFVGVELSKLGYYVVLLDGTEILNLNSYRGGDRLLFTAIHNAQQSQNALPGKVAVIGYSRGGGAALAYATHMPDSVAGVVAFYPNTSFIPKDALRGFVGKILVPVLMFAGGQDTYLNCCLIETARAVDTAAKEQGIPLTLIVYPDAAHDFIHSAGSPRHPVPGVGFNRQASEDSWNRTVAALRNYLR
jgi:acetyl esterase/lipase